MSTDRVEIDSMSDAKANNFYRILAGHNDAVKGKILGDWLIHDFISIFGQHKITAEDEDFNSATFREMPIGSKVVVYTTKHVFAIGEVKGDLKDRKESPPCKQHPYRNWRRVSWIKVGKLNFKRLPASVQKIGLPQSHFVKKIKDPNDYYTILSMM